MNKDNVMLKLRHETAALRSFVRNTKRYIEQPEEINQPDKTNNPRPYYRSEQTERYLIDFINILLYLKSKNHKNKFFAKTLYPNLTPTELILKKTQINSLLTDEEWGPLEYQKHHQLVHLFGEKSKNIFCDLFDLLCQLHATPNILLGSYGLQIYNSRDLFKEKLAITILIDIINKFKSRLFKEHLGQMMASLMVSPSYPRSLPYSSFYDKNGTANLLEQLASTDREKKRLSIDPVAFGNTGNKNTIFHFLIPSQDVRSSHVSFNEHAILAKGYGMNLGVTLVHGNKRAALRPGSYSVQKIEETNLKLDLIAFDPHLSIDLFEHKNNDQNKSLIVKQILSLLKALKQNGKLVLLINDRRLRRTKWLVDLLLEKTDSIIKLKTQTLICIKKAQSEMLSVFDGEDIVLSENSQNVFNNQTTDRIDYKQLTKEVLNKAGKYWKTISKEDWRLNKHNPLHIKRAYMPNTPGTPLEMFARLAPVQRYKSIKSDIHIGIKNLDPIPGNLDLEKKTQYKHTNLPLRKLEKSSILISLVGENLKPTRFVYKDTPIVLMPGVMPIEVDESKVSTEFLMYALRSEEVKMQLKYLIAGNVVKRLSPEYVFKIKIQLPENKVQEKAVVRSRKEDILKDLKLDKLFTETQKERFKKIRGISHDMGDYFSNIFPTIDLLLESVKIKKENEINRFFNDDELNLIESLKLLQKDIRSLSRLNRQFKEDLDYNKKYPLEMVSVHEFYKLTNRILKSIKQKPFVSKVEIRMLDLINEIDKNPTKKEIKKLGYDKTGLKLNKDAYERFLTQFIRNTEKHAGFDHSNKEKNIFKVRFDFDELNLNLIIMNNGTPFPENWDKERFIRHGETTNTDQGQGVGGEIINDIASHFQITGWSLKMDEDEDYPVQFIFPLSLEPIE